MSAPAPAKEQRDYPGRLDATTPDTLAAEQARSDREDIYVAHAYPEQLVDLGEVRLNYATIGDPSLPPLLLIPGQTESWWGYELAMPLLAERFRCYGVDLRGQGRSSWTPGRYSIDDMGNDLVRFIDAVIGRPTLISGLSSGGVLAAWLSAYARPGQIMAAVWEDPPLFSSELTPAYGHGMRQSIGPLWALYAKWLGDQWSVGKWEGLLRAAPSELPGWVAASGSAARTTWKPALPRTCENMTPSGRAPFGPAPSPRIATMPA